MKINVITSAALLMKTAISREKSRPFFPNIALKYIRYANLYKPKESKYSHDYKYVGEWRKINRI